MRSCGSCVYGAKSLRYTSCLSCFDTPNKPHWIGHTTETTTIPSASDLLKRAAAIMDERGKQYDRPGGERSMRATVRAFNIITGHGLTEADGWLLLQVLKDVRQWSNEGYHQDSAEDCIAYAALKAEALAKGDQ